MARNESAETTEEQGAEETKGRRQVAREKKEEPKVLKRRFKTTDFFRGLRIVGMLGKDAQAQLMGENFTQIDLLAILLTEGVDTFEAELYLWIADLMEMPTPKDEKEKNKLLDEFADKDIEFLEDVLDDLEVVGFMGFLRKLRGFWRKTSGRDSGSESTPSSRATGGRTGWSRR